ncbi:MAG: peptide-methionine (S)-S-oxide reductase MsrA [Campylobacterales bacterium]|nr:peptide-methionine (S)-S-oxide reductase MsrA [Campylobacterales bacterium]
MKLENITLAGGCFWCIEAVYQNMRSIQKVTSGYANGDVQNPTYKAVCGGNTGYAEAVKVEFDTGIVSLEQILDVFWHIHDPTTPNRQGADVGTQYRSGIYYTDEAQKAVIDESKKTAQEMFATPIVTEIKLLKNWYEAEEYHQNYFANNPYQGYCMAVVAPKVMKFREKFGDMFK